MKITSKSGLIASWLLFFPVIVTGSVFYEDRLSIINGYLSANTLLYFFSILFTLAQIKHYKRCFVAGVCLLFLTILLLSFFLFGHYLDLTKLVNYTLIGFLGGSILSMSIGANCERSIHIVTIYFMVVLFFLALLWKMKFGFWDRSVSYFMNGPIVFGKHMCIGLILAFTLQGFKQTNSGKLVCILFAFGVFWSMSKGPILALLLTGGVLFIRKMTPKSIILGASLLFVFYYSSPYILEYMETLGTPFARLIEGFSALVSGDYDRGSAAYGSVGARIALYSSAIDLFRLYPVHGIGIGEWASQIANSGTYPHNFYLEILAESGALGFICIAMPVSMFFFNFRDRYFYVPLFLMLAQQFSGDLADARWILVFSIYVISRWQYNIQSGKSYRIE